MTADDLEPLRAAALAGDPRAVDLVRENLRANGTSPARRLALQVLLAEIYQRQIPARIIDARLACGEARSAAAAFPPPLALLAVSADLAVWSGHVAAVQTCTQYAEQARDAGDLLRLALAASLRAVAVYHRSSCTEGRRLVGALRDRITGDGTDPLAPLAPMVQLGLTAMGDGCRPSCAPAAEPLPPLPGGILQPRVDDPDPRYLASRIWRYPAVHSCDAWAPPPAR